MKIKYNRIIASTTFMLVASASYAINANPIMFFGEDQGPLDNTMLRPNADTAKGAFFNALDTYGTEDFEDFNAGFGANGAVVYMDYGGQFSGPTTTLTTKLNMPWISESADLATSGNKLLNFNEGLNDQFTLSFDARDRVNSLGFYGIDVGDLGGQLTLTLENGTTQIITLDVPHTVPSALQTYFYFGIIIPDLAITAAVYDNTGGGSAAGFDAFLFDDITVGTSTYTGPGLVSGVPESGSTIASLGFGLILLNFGAVYFKRFGNRK